MFFKRRSPMTNLSYQMTSAPQTVLYQKARFVTHLPVAYRYTRTHFWAEKIQGSRWRLGFTAFATRLLGEIVDYNFETGPTQTVEPGQVLGWVEGFKAISEVPCAGRGVFAGDNPALRRDTELISRVPYGEGWLYEIDGELAPQSLDVNGYVHHLNEIIDGLLAKQGADGATEPGAA